MTLCALTSDTIIPVLPLITRDQAGAPQLITVSTGPHYAISTAQYSTVQYSAVQVQCDQYKWRRWQWSVAMGVSAPLRQAAAANVCQIRSFTFSAPFLFDSDIWESEGGSEPPLAPNLLRRCLQPPD